MAGAEPAELQRVHFYSWYSNYTQLHQTSTAQSGPTTSHSYKNKTTLPFGKMPLKYKRRCILHLKRDYKPAEYLSCVKDHKLRKTLTKYRLSDHCLAIERGRHRQRWQPQEQTLCARRKSWKQRNISYCAVITITTLELHISPNYNKLNQI